jgi:acrylyl-CoA reductase (NADPH)
MLEFQPATGHPQRNPSSESMNDTFKALVVDQKDGKTEATFQVLGHDALPEGDVTLSVAYSSLNYKDGLAVTGKAKVLRRVPLVPGVDLSGTVVQSDSPDFKPGDEVLITGNEIGEKFWGGYTQMTRVRSEWLVPLPKGLDLRQVMAIGTAGFTAMLSVMALEDHGLTPADQREVVVTGASGGVGSMAVALLARLGYNVVASTGRAESHEYLRTLGARDILDRAVLAAPPGRPLASERWAGAVDPVGGDILAGLLPAMARGSSIALSGNTGGIQLSATVLPFILRGVNLLGIDSVLCPRPRRLAAWQRLAELLPAEALELMAQEASLADVPRLSQEIVQGKIRGRVVIRVG